MVKEFRLFQELLMLLGTPESSLNITPSAIQRKGGRKKLPFCARHEIRCTFSPQNVFFHSLALLS